MHTYLTYYKEFKSNHEVLRNQFEDVTKECMSYLLNKLFHRDEFQKHIKVLFTIRNVPYDGNCGYHSILKSLTVIKRCTTAYDCLSLRRDMFKRLSSEKNINSFKRYMVNLYDLNEERMSQEVSACTYLENFRSNIYNDKCTKKRYYSKFLWFDMTNCLTILAIMYRTVFFYYYSELNKDVYI